MCFQPPCPYYTVSVPHFYQPEQTKNVRFGCLYILLKAGSGYGGIASLSAANQRKAKGGRIHPGRHGPSGGLALTMPPDEI